MPPLLTILSLLLFPLSLSTPPPPPHPDLPPLLTFLSILPPNTLPWSPSLSPCTFPGITCLNNRVIKLVLQNHSLSCPFPLSLLTLPHLRLLSLSNNNLSGPLPSTLPSPPPPLKLLFLSHNNLSGPIPFSLSSLSLLYRLDLSHNNLNGPLPSLSFSHLLTLRLQYNRLTGTLTNLHLPSIQDLNVTTNNLTGQIPISLSSFPVTSFSGNALCGAPLAACKESSSSSSNHPDIPGGGGGDDLASPVGPPGGGGTSVVVTSSPSSVPSKTLNKPGSGDNNNNSRKMSLWAIIAIILGDILVLGAISVLLYCYFCEKSADMKKTEKSAISNGEKILYSTSPRNFVGFERGEEGKMVFFEGAKKFELEDLLRASAEILGKGVFGTAYKAVLDDGSVVAVKRLKEMNCNGGGKKEIEGLMEVLGRLRHENLVGLKAYYFARDEKLLVFDYLPNGSLFWLLHGNRGPGRTPLDWTTRLKIAAGAARGVASIHNSCRALKLVHGNIKSTNILIDKAGTACVSDFGLSSFAPVSSTNSRSSGYRAPESLDGRRLTPKSDVYSFGVLLLELLTGKYPSVVEGSGPYGTVGVGGVVDLPRWVQSVVREEWTAEVFDLELMRYKDIEEEMVGLLQIAMACTSPTPDQRPRMGQVVKMIEEIRGVEVSPSHDALDSDSPSVSEDTGGVSQ